MIECDAECCDKACIKEEETREVKRVELVEFTVKVRDELITINAEEIRESSDERDPYVLRRFNNDNDFLRAIAFKLTKQN